MILVLAHEGRLRRRSEAERAGREPGRDRAGFRRFLPEKPRPESDAAPAGAGLTWPCALGRFRGTARRAIGPGREELADGGVDRPEKRGLEPNTRRGGAPRGGRALSERAARRDWSARQRTGRGVNIRLVRRSALLLPSFARGKGLQAYPAPYK